MFRAFGTRSGQITHHKNPGRRLRGRRRTAGCSSLTQSRKQLTKLRGRLAVLPEESQHELAPLFDAYIRMIGPSRLIRGVRQRIEEQLLSAESAVVAETEAIALTILAQSAPDMPADDLAGLSRRAEEVREIGRRLVLHS